MMKKITISIIGYFFILLINAQNIQSNKIDFEEELKKEGVIYGSENSLEIKQRGNSKLVFKILKNEGNSSADFNQEENEEHLNSILQLNSKIKLLGRKVSILETFSNPSFYMSFNTSDCPKGLINIVNIYKHNWTQGYILLNSLQQIFSKHKTEEINSSLRKIKELSSEVANDLIIKSPNGLTEILNYICEHHGAIPYNAIKIRELSKEIKTLENLIISHLAYLKIVTLK